MKTQFSASFFAGNRARLRELFTGTAPIVITANGLLQRSGDTNFPFRQDSSFWYLTGINDPDVTLVIDKGKEYLILPERSESRETFDGALNHAVLSTQSGIELILDEKTGWKQLNARIGRVQHVATLAPSKTYIPSHGLYANPARRRLIRILKAANPDIELLDLRPHLAKMRVIKQEQELVAIQRAIDITVDTLKKLRKRDLQKYEHEYQVEADITSAFRKANAHHAYEPIVAAGANACTLHYIQNDGLVASGDLLLLDVGAEVDGYAADITRTYAVGESTKRQRQIWQAVIDAQEFALSQLKPGTLLAECEKNIENYMGEKLRELGLIKSIDSAAVRQFYPHATSHFLGLDVHDVGDYGAPLEVGMVITCEPGIYVSAEGIGIRIEDDVLIQAGGAQVLSAKLPRELL